MVFMIMDSETATSQLVFCSDGIGPATIPSLLAKIFCNSNW